VLAPARPWCVAERREEERPTRRSPWEGEGRRLKGLTAFGLYITECYFQFMNQFFNGILWNCKLLMVFFRCCDLSMLREQFSLELSTLQG